MKENTHPYPLKVDLTKCENEPIHLIPQVQQHACLIACDPYDFKILQVSKNLGAKIGIPFKKALQMTLEQIIDSDTFHLIKIALEHNKDLKSLNPIRVGFEVGATYLSYNLIVHLHQQKLILEFEPFDQSVSTSHYHYQLSQSIRNIQYVKDQKELCRVTAEELFQFTGYDRVMVYKFDDSGNGQVIEEVKKTKLEPFLGLHYPASDIPKQARVLFLKNKVRLTSDVGASPSEIFPLLNPKDQQPLDLSDAVARGVSPVHLEYLSNMGVAATLSIAIEYEGDLWGLFALHHYSPKFISFDLRSTCGFIGQIFSGHLSVQSVSEYRQSVLEVSRIKSTLFDQMSKDWNVVQGLVYQDTNLMHLFDCCGACFVNDGNITTLGKTPAEDQLSDLIVWLNKTSETAVFVNDHLSAAYPPALAYKSVAAGILSVRIMPDQQNFIIWFRPETIQEVSWGGNPEKAIQKSDDGLRLSPRKSFDKWKQLVQGKSLPWQAYEKEVALALRSDIKDFIFSKYNELKSINKELTNAYEDLESFSYSVSHDLRAPLRNIKGFANILLEDYHEKLDDYGKRVVNTIVSSTSEMNSLINGVLEFSKVGRTKIILNELDFGKEAEKIFNSLVLMEKNKENRVHLQIQTNIPKIQAHGPMLNQLLQNLLSNAIKYSSRKPQPKLEIGGRRDGEQVTFYVKDNGIGFDEKYADRIFNVFTRLVSDDDYPGNGVGLAIVKRIVDKHNGKITVKSKPGVGTTFYVAFPVNP